MTDFHHTKPLTFRVTFSFWELPSLLYVEMERLKLIDNAMIKNYTTEFPECTSSHDA